MAINEDNSKKKKDGELTKEALGNQLAFLRDKGMLNSVTPSKSYGYKGKDPKQISVDYEIVTQRGDIYLVESATSLTSDRVQTKEWRFQHAKALLGKDAKAYLVVSDIIKKYSTETDSKKKGYYNNVSKYRSNIKDGRWLSYIDDIKFQSDFIDMIQDEVLSENGDGSKSSKKGLSYENWIAAVLSYENNLKIAKNVLSIAGGWDYDTFAKILICFGVNPLDIDSINATADIPPLPTYVFKNHLYGREKEGGKPRTDVAVTITFSSGKVRTYTISCKNTKGTTVTAHEWFPEHICDVLDLPESVYKFIKSFQMAGGITKLSQEEQNALIAELAPYVDDLNYYALSGYAKGNPTKATDIQIAEYILTRSARGIHIEKISDYIDKCKSVSYGQVGTILGWSVASTKKRKNGTKTDPKPIFKMKVF